MAAATTGLAAQGFRFVLQQGRFAWTHPAEVTPEAIDCTAMTDDDFEAFVRKTLGPAAELRSAP